MKNILALTILPLLVVLANCSGNSGGQWGGGDDDSNNPTDDGGATDDGTTPPGDDASTPPPPPSNTPLASGLPISAITVDQAVEVSVVKNGAPASKNAPIVAGRRAMVRVFVTPSGSFTHAITGVLTLHTGGKDHTFTASLTPKAASTDASFASTFNFNVDPASIGTDTTFLVQLKDPSGSGSGDTSAQYPKSGTPTSLGAQTSGEVKIYVIPIHFSSGGSTPATGGLDINAYQSIVMSMYPASNVTLTVEPTYNYGGSIPTANGTGWSPLLQALTQKRAADPSPDVYYYGAFAPSSSFASFCSQGCVAGLSNVPSSPNNASQKVSIGLVYGGDLQDQQATGQTMAHEVGHGHGREHSPTNYNVQGCSEPSGIDPSYPYANGAIGVWGYNASAGSAVDPSQYYDIMGYCEYDWISDYTYKALFDWIAADNGADMVVSQTPTMYRMITVEPDGSLDQVSDAFPVYGVVSGQARTVTFDDGGVTRTVTGYFTPFDHVAGGTIMVKEQPRFSITTLRVDGKRVKL